MKIREGKKELHDDVVAKNNDPYGACAVRYAQEWAEAMEARIATGAKLEDIADPTSHEVDRRPGFGITGFMYGWAVGFLAEGWVHGEELRVWHNAKYGVKADTGTVNPAIVTVELPDEAPHGKPEVAH